MGSALGGGDPALVVDLGGRDVPVAEELLDLADIDPGTQEQGGGGRPERVRRVGAGRGWSASPSFGLGVTAGGVPGSPG